MGFSKKFFWGAATAAYQIEGAAYEEGKGLSVWDMLCKKPGAVKHGDTGDHACDHYHRYIEDVALMKELGLQTYRFSISWPRVLSEGIGKVNEKGLEFYDRLVDTLLEAGIIPYITLFHWDYPYELYKKGGWLNPDSSDWFAEYTRVIVERLSDRVTHWFTLNEPQCFIYLGHEVGMHAPGVKLSREDVLLAAHNCLLAHGKAVETIRKYSKKPCKVGYAPVGRIVSPAVESVENIEAARRDMFNVYEDTLWNNTWWMDPVFLGQYPEAGLKVYEKHLPQIGQNDMKIINQELDFFAVNIYNGVILDTMKNNVPQYIEKQPGHPRTAINWYVTPEALYWGPRFFYERYRKPIIISENGLSNTDWVSLDQKVHDPQRIDFLHRYIRELKRAGSDGVPLLGYFCWSLLDNFEWAEGYNDRFGLIHVDYTTQKRTIKDSGYWYKKVIDSNGGII